MYPKPNPHNMCPDPSSLNNESNSRQYNTLRDHTLYNITLFHIFILFYCNIIHLLPS